jgi:hypothetical protein
MKRVSCQTLECVRGAYLVHQLCTHCSAGAAVFIICVFKVLCVFRPERVVLVVDQRLAGLELSDSDGERVLQRQPVRRTAPGVSKTDELQYTHTALERGVELRVASPPGRRRPRRPRRCP